MASRSSKGLPRSSGPTDRDKAGVVEEKGKGDDSNRLERCEQGCQEVPSKTLLPEVARGESGSLHPLPSDAKACTTTKAVFTAKELLLLSKVFPEIKSQLDAFPKVQCQEATQEDVPEWLVESDSELEGDELFEECDGDVPSSGEEGDE